MSLGSLVRTVSLGAIAAAAVACSSSNSTPTATTNPGTATSGTAANVLITIAGMLGNQSYSPAVTTVAAGQTVAWHNGDTITHTATSDSGVFDTGPIAPGATSSPITMAAGGTFPYHCSIHPTMVGQVVVTP